VGKEEREGKKGREERGETNATRYCATKASLIWDEICSHTDLADNANDIEMDDEGSIGDDQQSSWEDRILILRKRRELELAMRSSWDRR